MVDQLRALWPLTGIAVLVWATFAVMVLLDVGRRPPQARPGVVQWQYRLTAREARAERTLVLTPELRARTFTFAGGTSPQVQQLFLDAVAAARPEAQRLIGMVDGFTRVRFGEDDRGNAGHAAPGREWEILVDDRMVLSRVGVRGFRRTVLHELGHVVDLALLPDATQRALDERVPRGYACRPGTRESACAPREERFAETFSKWASGDLGAGLHAGYAVMPPEIPLEDWGAPLAALAAR